VAGAHRGADAGDRLLERADATSGALFVGNATRADFRVSPRIDWNVTGALTVSVGVDIFEGARRTLYGQFDGNDRAWMTTTWRF